MRDKLTEQIESLIMPFIEELSTELVALTMRRQGTTVVVHIIADKPNGGITIDECSYINKKAVRAIEERQWFGEDFIVEVSSPGLDRTLKAAKDFLRARGRTVRVHLLEPIAERVEYQGEVADVNDERLLIKYKDKIVTIPFKIISKAKQVIE